MGGELPTKLDLLLERDVPDVPQELDKPLAKGKGWSVWEIRGQSVFNSSGVRTGPNPQNIPVRTFAGRRIRDVIGFDYSQAELRIVALNEMVAHNDDQY